MARSKEALFEEDERLGSKLFYAMAHPARFRMMSRLVSGVPITYSDLIAGIPLDESTSMQHLSILKRLDFVKPGLLNTKHGGYVLNAELYFSCTAASKRIIRTQSKIRRLSFEESGDAGDVG
jgi:DNA-binding transcriptional ArsR family regulator